MTRRIDDNDCVAHRRLFRYRWWSEHDVLKTRASDDKQSLPGHGEVQ
jgi:hypothetical protein